MSDRLDKARRAFDDAVTADAEYSGIPELERRVFKLLDIARTQATIASAEALETLVICVDEQVTKLLGYYTRDRLPENTGRWIY